MPFPGFLMSVFDRRSESEPLAPMYGHQFALIP